jgi:hypothetical protein
LVAVVIIGVAVVRMLPSGKKSLSQASVRKAEAAHVEDGNELPGRVTTNPFFHPRLLPAKSIQPVLKPSGGGAEPPAGGSGPAFRGDGLPLLPTLEVSPPPAATTAEPAGQGQQSTQETKRRTVSLQAVLQAGARVAMVSVDGSTPVALKKGAQLWPGVRMADVQDDCIKLDTKRGRRSVVVGQTIEI